MGGECLNTGCVPSKALLAIAARAQAVRDMGRFGIRAQEPQVDFAGVMAQVRGVIAEIAPHDAQERFEAWGAEVIRAHARFTAPRTLLVAGRTLKAPRIVLAVGSRPAVPSIPGLDIVPFLTNETLFSIDVLPERLVVLGAGSVGMEMAQAFRRLGAEVAVIDRGPPLSRDEPEAAALVSERLETEGIALHRPPSEACRPSEAASRSIWMTATPSGEAISWWRWGDPRTFTDLASKRRVWVRTAEASSSTTDCGPAHAASTPSAIAATDLA